MISRLIRILLGAAIDGIQRFPLTAIALVLLAVIANLDIADLNILSRSVSFQTYTSLAAFSMASLVGYLIMDSRSAGRVNQNAAALLIGLSAGSLVWFIGDTGIAEAPFLAGLAGAVLVGAHWFRGTSAGFWYFVIRLLFAAGLAFIAVLVFAAGLSAIFASLDYLFGINVPGRIYEHVWAVSLIAAGPLFALGRIPRDFDVLPIIDGSNHGIAGLRLLSDYLAAPMLAVYALILHAYALKIVITGDVPQGQIGWMVIGYGMLIIFFWKLMLPLQEVLTVSGRAFLRFWPYVVVVPMGLLFYALWLRIGDYGMTPDRYFLAAFGGLMSIFAVMQAVPKLRNWLPGAAPLTVIVLLLGSFGPWGAKSISINSQVQQFAGLLNDKLQVSAEQGNRASSILYSLRDLDGLEQLKEVASGLEENPFAGKTFENRNVMRRELAAAFGVEAARKANARNRRANIQFKPGLVSTSGYDLIYSKFSLFPRRKTTPGRELRPGLWIRVEKRAIVVVNNGDETIFSLDPLDKIAGFIDSNPEVSSFELVSGTKTILLIPGRISFRLKPAIELTGGSGEVLLRSKDWAE